jgi:hypothetical protein
MPWISELRRQMMDVEATEGAKCQERASTAAPKFEGSFGAHFETISFFR